MAAATSGTQETGFDVGGPGFARSRGLTKCNRNSRFGPMSHG